MGEVAARGTRNPVESASELSQKENLGEQLSGRTRTMYVKKKKIKKKTTTPKKERCPSQGASSL